MLDIERAIAEQRPGLRTLSHSEVTNLWSRLDQQQQQERCRDAFIREFIFRGDENIASPPRPIGNTCEPKTIDLIKEVQIDSRCPGGEPETFLSNCFRSVFAEGEGVVAGFNPDSPRRAVMSHSEFGHSPGDPRIFGIGAKDTRFFLYSLVAVLLIYGTVNLGRRLSR